MYTIKEFIWYHIIFCFKGTHLWLEGFSQACYRTYYNGRFTGSILVVKGNGEQWKDINREIQQI